MSHRLSLQAQLDLENIYQYTLETWGVEQFEIYRGAINKALERIAKDPLTINSKAREDLYQGCRLFKVNKHYIAYTLKNGEVLVGRVLHEQMDFPRQVLEENFDY